jgi:hypothetical protein
MLALHCRTRISHALLPCVKDVHVLLCGKNGHLCVSNGILNETSDRDITNDIGLGWGVPGFCCWWRSTRKFLDKQHRSFRTKEQQRIQKRTYMFEIEIINEKKKLIQKLIFFPIHFVSVWWCTNKLPTLGVVPRYILCMYND